MFRKLLSSFKNAQANPKKQSVRLWRSEVKKYLDPEYELYRFSRFNHYIDENDELYEFIEGSHTVLVDDSVPYEVAANLSISFKDNSNEFEKKLLEHQSLVNPTKGTRGSTYKWIFEDGSLMTSLSSQRHS